MGWIKNGFILSFYFLKLYKIYHFNDQSFFKFALMKSISVGGDTDTNACVVMGMVGALIGYKNIPPILLGNILNFDCSNADYIKRDKFLSVKHNAVPLIDHIIKNRAQPGDKLKIINDFVVQKPEPKRQD